MIRIYTDKQTDNVIEAVDLGRVSLGETVKYTMYMKNTDIQWPVHNIRVQNVNPELRFEIPEILKANEVKEIFVYWTPKLDSREPLLTKFEFSGDLFIG
ncbi:MAG: hypothetical protein MT336_05650 [Candidatus Nitrosopumilus limneticus]|jgi:hypothetical protein|nr:hypothetical protein [Candidatus Nitrosopumilus limneticus]